MCCGRTELQKSKCHYQFSRGFEVACWLVVLGSLVAMIVVSMKLFKNATLKVRYREEMEQLQAESTGTRALAPAIALL